MPTYPRLRAQADTVDGTGSYVGFKSWVPGYLRDHFTPAAPDDQPVVTWTTNHLTALSSPVEYKMPGVDGGSAQSNLDGSTSANVRIGSGTYNTANGGSNDLCMYGSLTPGGDAQFRRWPVIVDFDTGSGVSVVEVSGYALSNVPYVLVEVNGYRINRIPMRRPSGANGWTMTLTFPTAIARRIRVYLDGTAGIRSVRVPTGQSVTKPGASTLRYAILGDSWAAGTGAPGGIESFAVLLARLMGADDLVHAAIGGTGFVAGTGGPSGAANPYSTRVSAILAKNPAVLIINPSTNDGASGTGVNVAAASLLASVSSIPKVYVVDALSTGYAANSEQVRAATLAAGRTYVDLRGWVTGSSGNAFSHQGNGTRDFLLFNDDSHPSAAAHIAIAEAGFRTIQAA